MMEDVKAEMAKLKVKKYPKPAEILKYLRYLINVLKYDSGNIYEDVPDWDKAAVKSAIAKGYRTADIYVEGTRKVGTSEMGEAVVAAL